MSNYKSIYTAAQRGAVVVTVNRRLAKTLLDGYAVAQQEAGCTVWQRPQIFTLDLWLRRCLTTVGEDWRLLNAAQANCLWQQVISADLSQLGLELLQVAATAKVVAQAQRLLNDAHIVSATSTHTSTQSLSAHSVFKSYQLSAEHHSFLRWQAEYLRRCRKNNWLDIGELTAYVADLFGGQNIAAPSKVLLLGFDKLTAAQNYLLEQLREQGCSVVIGNSAVDSAGADCSVVSCIPYSDEESELVAAARWARLRLEQQVGKVAVVVPDLSRVHSLVERIFSRELQLTKFPQLVPVETFNVSLGLPLAQHGLVATALMVLGVGNNVDFDTISYLLRSPWLGSETVTRRDGAELESWLRRQRVREITISDLLRLCRRYRGECKFFVDLLVLLRDQDRTSSYPLPVWVDKFTCLLQQAGWPGGRSLTSSDYQLITAWREKLLPAVAALNVVHGATDYATAVGMLRKLATEQLFQPQAQDDRLQVTGILETAGLHFDALLVIGLTDKVLPGQVSYNPFLPVALQRQYQMPHSSVQHENDYAKGTIQRLVSSAPEVVLSYPCGDGDMQLTPSPFIVEYLADQGDLSAGDDSLVDNDVVGEDNARDDNGGAVEFIADDVGLPLLSQDEVADGVTVAISGGTSLLKEQAQCPFRAYGHHRLKVRALEVVQCGIDGRLRGDLVHKIMEQFWQQVGSQQQLCALEDDKLYGLVSEIATAVLAQTQLNTQAAELVPIEHDRLVNLIVDWLQQVEKIRLPFTVQEVEQQQQITVGPLVLRGVPDRIDQLVDGQQVVIDYKSAVVKLSDLVGEKLLEPQLPMYALHLLRSLQCSLDQGLVEDDPIKNCGVAAIAFAQLRAGECSFRGVSQDGENYGELLPGVREVAKTAAAKRGLLSWQELLDDWQQQLEQLATDFAHAQAQVQPAQLQVCQFCDLRSLCRIDARLDDVADGTVGGNVSGNVGGNVGGGGGDDD